MKYRTLEELAIRRSACTTAPCTAAQIHLTEVSWCTIKPCVFTAPGQPRVRGVGFVCLWRMELACECNAMLVCLFVVRCARLHTFIAKELGNG